MSKEWQEASNEYALVRIYRFMGGFLVELFYPFLSNSY
jgi:hypothetical protein